MQPDSGKTLGRNALIGHLIEEIGHGHIIKPDRCLCRSLANDEEIVEIK